jgi:hypothetical protein
MERPNSALFYPVLGSQSTTLRQDEIAAQGAAPTANKEHTAYKHVLALPVEYAPRFFGHSRYHLITY